MGFEFMFRALSNVLKVISKMKFKLQCLVGMRQSSTTWLESNLPKLPMPVCLRACFLHIFLLLLKINEIIQVGI